MKKHIAACSFAENLTPGRLPSLSPVELQLHLQEMVKYKVILPKGTQILVVAAKLKGLIEASPKTPLVNNKVFANVLSFPEVKSTTAGAGGLRFDPSNPRFASVDEVTPSEVMVYIIETFMGEKVLAAVIQGDPKIIVDLATALAAILIDQDKLIAQSITAHRKAQKTLQVLRCLLALFDTKPGAMGSSKADVEAIINHTDSAKVSDKGDGQGGQGEDSEDAHVKELFAVYKDALMDNHAKRVGGYWQVTTREATHAPMLAKLCDDILTHADGAISNALSALPGLRQNLRTGATDDIEKLICEELNVAESKVKAIAFADQDREGEGEDAEEDNGDGVVKGERLLKELQGLQGFVQTALDTMPNHRVALSSQRARVSTLLQDRLGQTTCVRFHY